MELFIDTTDKNFLQLRLTQAGRVLARRKIKTNFNQSEKLWPALDKLLAAAGADLPKIKKIIVANGAGSFTSLRIGIAAANGLAYALGIAVADDQGRVKQQGRLKIVAPRYERAAKIG